MAKNKDVSLAEAIKPIADAAMEFMRLVESELERLAERFRRRFGVIQLPTGKWLVIPSRSCADLYMIVGVRFGLHGCEYKVKERMGCANWWPQSRLRDMYVAGSDEIKLGHAREI